MKIYWDTSALVDALVHDGAARREFDRDHERITRSHALTEAFSVLTGGKLGFRIPADEASRQLHALSLRMTVLGQDATETLVCIATARARGVQGGAIHDLQHALAAERAAVDRLATYNTKDFERITTLQLLAPSEG